jgi:putative aldouronate transport system substrate-binding protein
MGLLGWITAAFILGSVAEAQEGVAIELYVRLASPEVGPPPEDWFWPLAVSEQLGIEVTVTFVSAVEEYMTQLDARANAGDLPDLFIAPNRAEFVDFAQRGLLADWTPYLGTMPSFVAMRAASELAFLGVVDGARYGLAVREPGPFARSLVAVRQDWLDALGLQAPVTLDDYFDVAVAFAQADPDGDGLADTFGWSGAYAPYDISSPLTGFQSIYAAHNALGVWRMDQGVLEFAPTTDDRRAALEYIHRLYAAGAINPDLARLDSAAATREWQSGQVGIINGDFCAIFCPQSFSDFAAANPTGVLIPIAPPVGPEGASGGGAYVTSASLWLMSASAVVEGKAEAIARLLDWLATDGYLLTAFGEEGINYIRDESGRIVVADEDGILLVAEPFTVVDYQAELQLRHLAYMGGEDEYRLRYDEVVNYVNGQSINPYTILTEIAVRPAVDFTPYQLLPLPSDVGIDAVDELALYITENELYFAIGSRPLDEWDAYVAEMETRFGLSGWVEAARAAAAEQAVLEP